MLFKENVSSHWKSFKFSLALQSEALVNTSRRVDFLALPLYAENEVLSRVRALNHGQTLHLHPYFVYASSEGSGESGLLCRLAIAFIA